MRVLHLFCWNLKDIIGELPKIQEQGFEAIQISPIQPLKENYSEWWMCYQTTSFNVGNKYGSKEDLINLTNEANKYNIKIIADVVCNHTAGKIDGSLYPHELVDSYLKSKGDFWKEPRGINDWNNRYEVTNYCLGLPGLNVSNHDLQDIIIKFLNELIDCGVMGFRFDSAKCIALPDEGCDFWPRVIYCLKKYGLIVYGEVIFADRNLVDRYSQYINVLTNCDGSNREKIFSFVESHDSYLDYCYTKNMSSNQIINQYSELTKSYPNTLFYARPFDDSWKSDVVKKANMYGIKQYSYR